MSIIGGVVGGQLLFTNMNKTLTEEKYAVCKAYMWFNMLQDDKIPTRWYVAGKKGTTVNFNVPKAIEELDESFAELEVYMNKVNKTYDLDLQIIEQGEVQ